MAATLSQHLPVSGKPCSNTTSDPFNFKSDKGDADLDRRHTFVGNLVYVLPSFRKWGKAAQYTLGDWQLNGIASYFGATPIELVTNVNTIGTASAVGQRLNYTGAPLYLSGDPTHHLNPAAFARMQNAKSSLIF